MTSKYIAWILGVVLVVVLVVFAWLWKSKEKSFLVPAIPSETGIIQEKSVTSEVGKNEAQTGVPSASLDDIANNIGSDASDDLSAIDDEAVAETNSVEEGGDTINDLGKTYDESRY